MKDMWSARSHGSDVASTHFMAASKRDKADPELASANMARLTPDQSTDKLTGDRGSLRELQGGGGSAVLSAVSPRLTDAEDEGSDSSEDSDDDEAFLVMRKPASLAIVTNQTEETPAEDPLFPQFTAVIQEHNFADIDVEEEFLSSDPIEDEEEGNSLSSTPLPVKAGKREMELPLLDMIDTMDHEHYAPSSEWIKVSYLLTDTSIMPDVAESGLLKALSSLQTPQSRIPAKLDLYAFYTSHSQFTKAAKLADSLIQDYELVYGSRHPNIPILSFNMVAQSWLDAKDWRAALATLLRICGFLEKVDDNNAVLFVEATCSIAIKANQYAEVESALQTILARLSKSGKSTNKTMFKTMVCLARLYIARGEAASAKAVLSRCVAAMDKVLADDDAEFVETKWTLARILLAEDNFEAARDLLDDIVAVSGHLRTAMAKYVLARIYIAERRYEAAEFLLAEAFPELFKFKESGVVDGEVLNSALLLNTFCHLRLLKGQHAEVLRLCKSLTAIGKSQALKSPGDMNISWLMVGDNLAAVSRVTPMSVEDRDSLNDLIARNKSIKIGFPADFPDSLLIGRGRRNSWFW
ncbi:hypothetical protein BC830DRAFT_833208 [Chytriomyces sp. MP71]|nr:hypothetical protein BC830DRAFT_833208 [Chytriomyces sp. MP71]